MENLSPHKEFKTAPLSKPCFRPFYIHKWPKDLPSTCENCGAKFYVGINLQIGRNRFFRFLRHAAFLSFGPSLISPFVLEYFFPNMFDGLAYNRMCQLVLAMMFFPPPILWVLSSLGPITRHVTCLKCDWNKDYPSLKAMRKRREKETV
jgi:hypothetical protein